MKVAQLIKMLEDMDPNANVILVTQKKNPLESTVARVTTRADVSETDEGNDVFLVEGEVLGYGSKASWD